MISQWIPPVVTTTILGIAAWIGLPRLISAWIDRAVQHKLDERLERVRAEIRTAESSIDALRAGALSGVTTRQSMLDARRLVAAERLWAAVVSMHNAKTIALMSGSIKLDVLLTQSNGTGEGARGAQQFAKLFLKGLLPDGWRYDPAPDLERPFVSPQAWSIFVAYRLAVAHPVMVFTLAQTGMGAAEMQADPAESLAVLKGALPHYSEFIDRFGLGGMHHLIPRLEERLLSVLDADLKGTDAHAGTVDAAAEIIRKAESVFANLTATSTGPTPQGLKA